MKKGGGGWAWAFWRHTRPRNEASDVEREWPLLDVPIKLRLNVISPVKGCTIRGRVGQSIVLQGRVGHQAASFVCWSRHIDLLLYKDFIKDLSFQVPRLACQAIPDYCTNLMRMAAAFEIIKKVVKSDRVSSITEILTSPCRDRSFNWVCSLGLSSWCKSSVGPV